MLCALAPTIEVLVAGRALQGVFGALLTPSALAVIIAAFPPDERGAAIGSWTAWGGIATVIGPLVGGVLVDAVSWRLIFAINVPFVLAHAGADRRRRCPRARAGARTRRVDWLGALLHALGLAGPVLALIRQPEVGWGSPQVWVPALLGHRAARPLPRARAPHARARCSRSELFRRRNFAVGNLETFAMYGGLSAMFFFLVLFLQQVAGYDALEAGLATLPIDDRHVRCSPSAPGASPTATARACSWASGRSSPRSASR